MFNLERVTKMKHNSQKVVIVGVGNVGSMTAYTLLNQGLCKEIVLIDRNEEKALGEALDMQHAAHFMDRKMNVRSGSYKDCEDADIVIITASAPMNREMTDRTSMLAPSKAIMKSIVTSIMENHFNGIMIIISNPVDIMTYYAWKLSGLPKNHVIGSGTTLDSTRLDCAIADVLNIDSKSVNCAIIGEHGKSSVPVYSSAIVGGKKLTDILTDDFIKEHGVTKDYFKNKTIAIGTDILKLKGNTSYGIAASVSSIVKAILFDEDRVMMVTTFLNGEYGIKDFALSLPCVLNADGIRENIEIHLNEEEEKQLKDSASFIASFYPILED